MWLLEHKKPVSFTDPVIRISFVSNLDSVVSITKAMRLTSTLTSEHVIKHMTKYVEKPQNFEFAILSGGKGEVSSTSH
jgi:hypothetical protein